MTSPLWSTPLEEWQFLLARQLHGLFDPEAWEARDGSLRFRGRFLVEPEQAFSVLADRLRPMGYAPQLLRPDEVAFLRLAPAAHRPGARRWAVPAGLFVLTILSTFLVGGVAYAASIMGILLVHELGHYVTARLYGMRVSPPFFIPMPISLMGTMGAIIRMRSPVPHRQALFDVGIAGPLAGLAVAIPVTVVGLLLSRVVPDVPDLPGVLRFGEPLLFRALARLVVGPVQSGQTILVHPVAFAGWLGFFVTALNLIPAGQLDGGHVAYAVLGRRHDKVALVTVFALFGMALYSAVRSAQPQLMWAVWGALLLIMGYRHPPPLNDLTPLDPVRRAIGVLSWGLFLTLITIEPFEF
jgi:Zn-dependent protease